MTPKSSPPPLRRPARCRLRFGRLWFALMPALGLGCAGAPTPAAPPPPELRGTEPGDRVGPAFEVVSVHEEPLQSGGARMTYRIRNLKAHRNFKVQVRLERLSPDSRAVVDSIDGGIDYLHQAEEIEVEFEAPPDHRPAGCPALCSRLVVTAL